MTIGDNRIDAEATFAELRNVPGFSFPPGEPSTWTPEQCEWAYREGNDDSEEWIKERRELIERGALVLRHA